jgi:alpha-amylase
MFFSDARVSALSLVTLLSFLRPCFGATLEEWRGRSIYQVMTDRFAINSHTPWTPCPTQIGPYCGGTWRGIMENLDYIQGMNFDAIWVSPVVTQLPQYTKDGQSYAGYWQQDLYTINPKFGSPDDLHALIDAVHSRGMLFMLDIVVNHMAYNSYLGGPDAIQYSIFNPFNNESYYHSYCDLDYSGKNLTSLEVCWLGSDYVPLADLKTESQVVRDMFGDWIEEMVGNWSVDGLRIDAGVNVEPEFFTGFMKRAGVFATAEVYHTNDSVVAQWEETVGSTLNYPLYWPLISAFESSNGSFDDLVKMMASEQKSFNDVNVLGTFSEVRTTSVDCILYAC